MIPETTYRIENIQKVLCNVIRAQMYLSKATYYWVLEIYGKCLKKN